MHFMRPGAFIRLGRASSRIRHPFWRIIRILKLHIKSWIFFKLLFLSHTGFEPHRPLDFGKPPTGNVHRKAGFFLLGSKT
jgi:hypothetical protein